MMNLQIGIPRPTYLVHHECTEPPLAASAQIPFVRMAVDEEPRVWKPRILSVLGIGYSHQIFCAAKKMVFSFCWVCPVLFGICQEIWDLPGGAYYVPISENPQFQSPDPQQANWSFHSSLTCKRFGQYWLKVALKSKMPRTLEVFNTGVEIAWLGRRTKNSHSVVCSACNSEYLFHLRYLPVIQQFEKTWWIWMTDTLHVYCILANLLT